MRTFAYPIVSAVIIKVIKSFGLNSVVPNNYYPEINALPADNYSLTAE